MVPCRSSEAPLSTSIGTWLAHGDAGEADWGAHVRRLALREGLGSGGDGLLLDLPALAQPYACRSVACAPALRAARTRSCCADLDVTLTPDEQRAITTDLAAIGAWMQARDPRWKHGPVAPFDADQLTRPGGRCVFAAPGPEGLACGLHAVENASGRTRGTLKPMPCRLFPLVVIDLGEDRVLLSAVTRHTARHVGLPSPAVFPCLRGDTTETVPLVDNVADTLAELWGEATARTIQRAVTGWRRRTAAR